MPPKWLRNDDDDKNLSDNNNTRADVSSIEIKPEMITSAIKPHLDATKNEISAAMDEKLKPVMEYFAAQNRNAEEARRRKNQEESEVEDVDYISDPDGAINKKLAPIIQNQQAANAMIMINETLGQMDYYSTDPDFKAKVLSKINSQPLAIRSNPEVILNCYKLIRYDEDENIKSGKYKSQLSATTSTHGTGGHTGTSKKEEDEVTISEEEKYYAKKMGIKEEDWIKSKRSLEYV